MIPYCPGAPLVVSPPLNPIIHSYIPFKPDYMLSMQSISTVYITIIKIVKKHT
ncbi:unnamed protein product, partial [Staurois parvus]